MKKLSFIITAHNLETMIAGCLNSLIECISHSDVEDDIEILVVDDKSSDNTYQVLLAFSHQYNFVKLLKTDFGNIGKVRNYAISNVSGEYITFIDGDDILPKFDLTPLISLMKSASPDIILSKMYEATPDTLVSRSSFSSPQQWSKDKAITEFLIHKKFQAHFRGKYIKKSILASVKIPEITCYEDALSFPEILNNSDNIYYCDNVLYNYIKRDNSLSAKIDSVKANTMSDIIMYMTRTFEPKFNDLTLCHGITLLFRQKDNLSFENKVLLKNELTKIKPINFILNKNIRFSIKQKLIKFYLLKHYF